METGDHLSGRAHRWSLHESVSWSLALWVHPARPCLRVGCVNETERDGVRRCRAASTPNLFLKAHRDRLGLTQQEVADALLALAWEHDHEKLGVDAAMVSKWERGQKRPRKLYRLLLCRLYDSTEEQLGLRQGYEPAAEVQGTDLLQDVAQLPVGAWRH
jgi:transcriptional regulator with XRE-family HTH domain